MPDQVVNRTLLICLVMASPSPLDRCWVVKDSPGSSQIMLAVRAAVERQWPDTHRAAAYVLGDETLAAEIMEEAIEQAVAYLVDHPPKDHEEVRAVLSRFCKLEVGRRRKQRAPFVFIDSSVASEASSSDSQISAVDAAIDAERILADAPLQSARGADDAVRQRSESWSDVAARTATSPGAIRKKCKRCLDRIRQKLGIPGAPQ